MGITSPDYNAVQVLGNTGTSTNAITPTEISGMTNGVTRAWVLAAHTHTYGSTPTGWTALFTNLAVASSLGAAVAAGGQRFLSAFYRDKDSGWSSMPSFAMSSVANGTHALCSFGLDRDADDEFNTYAWNTPTYTSTPGVDTSAGTGFATGNTSKLVTHVGGMLMAAIVNNDGATFTPTSFTHTGTTVTGGLVERGDNGSTTGFDVGMAYNTGLVAASSGGNNPFTISGTHSAATQGGVVFIEQTQTATPRPAGAAISTLTADFDGPSALLTDDPIWDAASVGFQAYGVANQIANSSSYTADPYDLTSGSVKFQIRGVGRYGGAATQCNVGLFEFDGGVATIAGFVFINDGVGGAITVGVGNLSGITGASRTHSDGDWYRISESGGIFTYAYSADGTSWTTLDTASVLGVNKQRLGFAMTTGAGGTISVDNVNKSPVAVPLFSTLIDDFNTGSVPDPARWTASNNGGTGSVVLTGGKCVITGGDEGSQLVSYTGHTLSGSSIYFQVNDASPTGMFMVGPSISGLFEGFSVSWGFASGNAEATFVALASSTPVAHVAGQWYRIRETSGTVYMEYSANGTSWTTLASETISNIFGSHALTYAPAYFTANIDEMLTIDSFNAITPPPAGTASGSYTWAGSATGKKTPKASNTSAAYTWAGSSTGKKTPKAGNTSAAYTWDSTQTGKVVKKGLVSAAYTWAATSTAEQDYAGTTAGAYAWASTSVTGLTPVAAPTGYGSYNFAGSAVGYRYQSATAGGTFDWASTKIGKFTPIAVAATALYNWAATQTGKRYQKGLSSGAYNWECTLARGNRQGAGITSGAYNFASLATGLFTPHPQPGAVGWWLEE